MRTAARRSLGALVALSLTASAPSETTHAPQQGPAYRFAAHEIATGLRGGYQTIAVDLNRDGKLDLIAVASNLPELVWFENPTWARHVLASGMRGLINAAAHDLDGDGIPEIAVASGFSTNPAQSVGTVSLLTHGPDPTQPWTVREIDRTPTAHRVRWLTQRGQVLLNSPLSGATATLPNYEGPTPIYAYRAPDWKRETVTTAETGVVHSIEPAFSPFCSSARQCFLSAGFDGIHRYEADSWTRTRLTPGDPAPVPKGGSSDIALGKGMNGPGPLSDVVVFSYIAAIEPWHGNQVVIHRMTGRDAYERRVIDTAVVDGHTIVTADLDADGRHEVIVGQRAGTRSVWIYSPNRDGTVWTRSTLDEGGMAAAGCVAADLNGDQRIDIACIGTATANLKWYENLGPR